MHAEFMNKKILVVIPHFFNGTKGQLADYGSEDLAKLDYRRSIVEECYETLKKSLSDMNMEFEILRIGIKNLSLVQLDVEVETENPRFIPWLAIDHAYKISHIYDYVLVVEDDILVEEGTITELLAFNSNENSDYILIPNRVEVIEGNQFCTDMIAMPGWKESTININGSLFREPINIHSGMFLLTSSKFREAFEKRPFKTPTIIIGGYMASALANMLAYFRILRKLPTSTEIPVTHLDSWVERQILKNPSYSQTFNASLKLQSSEEK
jgi:hypothetical protein